VGFIILVAARRGAGELSNVFVARSHRSRGVGTMLIARAVEAAKTRDYTSLHLVTNAAFAGACAYYDGHGWEREGPDDPEALLYWLRLREAPDPPPVASLELPPLLRGVLSLLDKLTHRRERLQRDLVDSRQA
jgi:Acetyltransferase (GNAT) domain